MFPLSTKEKINRRELYSSHSPDHKANLLYCDYLPPNIFPITGILANGFAELLLADFGLADCY